MEFRKALSEASKEKSPTQHEGYLLWGCFVNWAATLEKIDKGLIKGQDEEESS
jgi:hypothetical protein